MNEVFRPKHAGVPNANANVPLWDRRNGDGYGITVKTNELGENPVSELKQKIKLEQRKNP
jgi:hypothetical protein